MKKTLLFSIVFSLLTLAVIVSAASLTITTPKRLPDAFVGEPYNAQIQVREDGTPPYFFSLNEGKGDSFPPGINFSPSSGESPNGTISISGTPTKEGAGQPPRKLFIRVIDSSTGNGEKEFELRLLTKQLKIINPGGDSLPSGTVGEPYSGFTFEATDGIRPYVWSNPETPDGVILSDLGLQLSLDGKISGRPIRSNSRKVYIRVKGEPIVGLEGINTFFTSFSLKINSATFEFITAGFSEGQVNKYYGVTLAAHGGTPPYLWEEIPAGSLPPGLKLSGDVISGTPTKEGNFPFSLLLKDSEGEELNNRFSITISGVCKENCGPAPGEPGPGGESGTISGPKQEERVLEINWPPSPLGTNLQTDSITLLIKYLYEWAIGIGGFLAFISLVIAGVQYLTSTGNTTKMKDAMDRIRSAGLGLVLLLSAVLILNVINPQLTELEITSDPLNIDTLKAISPTDLPSLGEECAEIKINNAANFEGAETITRTPAQGCQPLNQEVGSIIMTGSCQVILNYYPCNVKNPDPPPEIVSSRNDNVAATYGTSKFVSIEVKNGFVFDVKNTQ